VLCFSYANEKIVFVVTRFQLLVYYIHVVVCVDQFWSFVTLISSLDMWCLHLLV